MARRIRQLGTGRILSGAYGLEDGKLGKPGRHSGSFRFTADEFRVIETNIALRTR